MSFVAPGWIGLAALATLLWVIGRNAGSTFLRQALWIFAASQLIAFLLVMLGFFLKWALIVGLVICVVLGLAFLFLDRR